MTDTTGRISAAPPQSADLVTAVPAGAVAPEMVRHDAAWKEVVDLCSGKRRWTMTVPAEPDRDSDLVIGAALDDVPVLLKRLAVAEGGDNAAIVSAARVLVGEWSGIGTVGPARALQNLIDAVRTAKPSAEGGPS